jgi:hypothetical protein
MISSVDRPAGRAVAGMTTDAAETLAAEVLCFLAAEKARLVRFMKASGLEPDTIRQVAATRPFLLGVLDYLAADEDLLKLFAHANSCHPSTVMVARSALAPPKAAPRNEPPSPSIIVECERCKTTSVRRRRLFHYAPEAAVKLVMMCCGECGGGFDQEETWYDRRGMELAS